MREQDFDGFAALLDGAIALNPNWKPIAPAGKALFFKAMAAYTLEQVSAAMTAHIRDGHAGMFQPTPAHLIAQIEARAGDDGRPGADEAWALCLRARDEAETVVWTAEMQAAFNLCRPALESAGGRGDTAARMAFREAYVRLVAQARRAQAAPAWSVSLGHDAGRREEAVRQARAAGRLSAPQAAALLPGAARERAEGIDPGGLTRLKAALAELKPASESAALRRERELRTEKDAQQAHKARMKERLARYLEELEAESAREGADA